ncbi:L,D-transpeptidase family protein [Profundibacterium mesophilum]|uniref:Localization factor PodJL n=1 Tax=Profundibacterium mesophilum KAUST100406-0324 TaxID=1037889 RepID=A0A921NU42_9RHOB|nr:L,D-transpeptidase [Profundibacterium mesophilum]KAF0674799.1 localization factor PodJL [Profundibacterium mesophilum KAUST100406-0324]
MTVRPALAILALAAAPAQLVAAPPASIARTPPDAIPAPAQIDSADYTGGALPEGRSAITVRLQVLLDRAGVSPGVIDGYAGEMSRTAIAAFELREGLPVDGAMDGAVWSRLNGAAAGAVTASHIISQEDVADVGGALPDDYTALADRQRIGYERASEALAERFHMDEAFLEGLNPGARFVPGERITVVDPGGRRAGAAVRVVVDKQRRRATAYGSDGLVLADYPVTIGSSQTPSPSGIVEVTAIAIEPNYSYKPDENFTQGDNDEFLLLPPGPNGPVGSVWIDLSKPTYGLHGTSDPDSLFEAASHGCVRFTNWDAQELAHMVKPGTVVEFAR